MTVNKNELEIFGTIEGGADHGQSVYRMQLTGGGLTANILTWGAVLQDLHLAEHEAPLVLGFQISHPIATIPPTLVKQLVALPTELEMQHSKLMGRFIKLIPISWKSTPFTVVRSAPASATGKSQILAHHMFI